MGPSLRPRHLLAATSLEDSSARRRDGEGRQSMESRPLPSRHPPVSSRPQWRDRLEVGIRAWYLGPHWGAQIPGSDQLGLSSRVPRERADPDWFDLHQSPDLPTARCSWAYRRSNTVVRSPAGGRDRRRDRWGDRGGRARTRPKPGQESRTNLDSPDQGPLTPSGGRKCEAKPPPRCSTSSGPTIGQRTSGSRSSWPGTLPPSRRLSWRLASARPP